MYDQLNEPCSRCKSSDIVSNTAAGDILCRNCGEIQVSRIIDCSAEWREFDEDDRGNSGSAARSSCTNERFGSSTTYFTGGLSEAARQALAKTQTLSTDKRELKLNKAADIISNIGSTLHLTRKILDCAYHLCSRAVMENSTQAKRNELLAAAVISLACRLEGYPRTLQEISNATQLDVHTINRVQSTLARELHISTGRVAPQDLVARIVCNPLIGMTDPVMIQHVKDICRKASEEGILDGQQPQATAAATIIFTSMISTYFNKLKEKHKNNINDKTTSGNNYNDNYDNDRKNCKVERFYNCENSKEIEPRSLNISLTIVAAAATITGVKKAYNTILLNINAILPLTFQETVNKYCSLCVIDREAWFKDLSTFDEFSKSQKQKQLKPPMIEGGKKKTQSNSLASNRSISGPSEMKNEVSKVSDRMSRDGRSCVGAVLVKSSTAGFSPTNSVSSSSSILIPLSPANCSSSTPSLSSTNKKNTNMNSPAAAVAHRPVSEDEAVPSNENTDTSSSRHKVDSINQTSHPISPKRIATIAATSPSSNLSATQTFAHTINCTGNNQILNFAKIKNEIDCFATNYCRGGVAGTKVTGNQSDKNDGGHSENRINIEKKRYLSGQNEEDRRVQIVGSDINVRKLQKIGI